MTDFLVQLLRRFQAETPWFHKVVRAVSIVVAVIAATPQFLDAAGLMELLPGSFVDILTKVVSIASIVAAFVAQLATTEQAKQFAQQQGKPIK